MSAAARLHRSRVLRRAAGRDRTHAVDRSSARSIATAIPGTSVSDVSRAAARSAGGRADDSRQHPRVLATTSSSRRTSTTFSSTPSARCSAWTSCAGERVTRCAGDERRVVKGVPARRRARHAAAAADRHDAEVSRADRRPAAAGLLGRSARAPRLRPTCSSTCTICRTRCRRSLDATRYAAAVRRSSTSRMLLGSAGTVRANRAWVAESPVSGSPTPTT